MPITLNGTTGVVTPGATVGSITGILKATSGVVSQAVAGTDYLTSSSGGSITLATAQTASGTAVDFTGIPSWAKRITVMFDGVSTNGSSQPLIQIGSGSIQTTGYNSASRETTVTGTGFPVYNNGFVIQSLSSVNFITGHMTLTLMSSNSFVSSHCFYFNQSGNTFEIVGAGSVSLSGALDRLRITTVNGTDTFDAGTINISYE
jgi:hypothetical protein